MWLTVEARPAKEAFGRSENHYQPASPHQEMEVSPQPVQGQVGSQPSTYMGPDNFGGLKRFQSSQICSVVEMPKSQPSVGRGVGSCVWLTGPTCQWAPEPYFTHLNYSNVINILHAK